MKQGGGGDGCGAASSQYACDEAEQGKGPESLSFQAFQIL
jgi:hypothetical protein